MNVFLSVILYSSQHLKWIIKMFSKLSKDKNWFCSKFMYNFDERFYPLQMLTTVYNPSVYMKSSDAKASKCHLKFSSLMMIFYQTCIFKFSYTSVQCISTKDIQVKMSFDRILI